MEGKNVWRPEQFDDDPAIIFLLDSTFCLRYCNAAWDRFARENGGSHLLRDTQIGRSVIEVAPSSLRPFYSTLYQSVLDSGEETYCFYECSSDEIFRRFHMHVARKTPPDQNPFLVVINSVVLEQAHQLPSVYYDPRALREKNGLITMCSHCRRTRLPEEDSWVWVPELVRRMPREVSHGICAVCFDIYYGT